MKISKLIQELQSVKENFGDIEISLQDDGKGNDLITGYCDFFVVPEEYEKEDSNSEVICNIRWWPY